MNPFDPKTALLAKHAQHVVLIHFPIALFLTGAAFDLAAHWTKRRTLAAAAYLNIVVAAIFVVPTLATGIAAWQWLLEGKRLKGLLLLHVVLAAAAAILIWTVTLIQVQRRRAGQSTPGYCLALEVVTVIVIGLTAHLGGFLSGVNVPG